MPAALDIDKDQVKMLALEFGVREAARKLELPEATVQAWSARGKWFVDTITPKPPHLTPATVATKPADLLAQVISENKLATRSGLAQFTADAATKLSKSKGNLKLSRPAKDIADIMSKVWSEAGSSTTFNMAVLCDQTNIQVIGPDPVP